MSFLHCLGVPDVNSTKCQGCKEDCKFHDCNVNKRAACENVVNPNNNVTTPKYQSFQSTNEARHQTTERRQHRITKVTLHRTTEVMSLQTSEDTSDRTTKRDLSGLSAGVLFIKIYKIWFINLYLKMIFVPILKS